MIGNMVAMRVKALILDVHTPARPSFPRTERRLDLDVGPGVVVLEAVTPLLQGIGYKDPTRATLLHLQQLRLLRRPLLHPHERGDKRAQAQEAAEALGPRLLQRRQPLEGQAPGDVVQFARERREDRGWDGVGERLLVVQAVHPGEGHAQQPLANLGRGRAVRG